LNPIDANLLRTNKMPVDIVLIATIVASQGYAVPSFIAASKDFYNDTNLLAATKNLIESKKKRTRLMHACSVGNVARATSLIQVRADVNAASAIDTLTPLMFAADNGHTEIVRLLLEAGANPNVSMATRDYDTPLLMAIRWEDLELVKLLVLWGATVDACNRKGTTALASASDTGYTDMVEFLIECGADVNAKQIDDHFTPLLYACQSGRLETARLLLDRGALVDAHSIYCATPLMWAASQGHTELCSLLIERGADVNAYCIRGITPLMMAAEAGKADIVELLLTFGVKIDEQDLLRNGGNTALLFASQNGSLPAVRILLQAGANVNIAAVGSGATPLMWAARNGNLDMVKLMVEHGANIHACQVYDTWNARSFAAQNGHTAVCNYLLDLMT